MGCTIVVMVVQGNTLTVGHVGDSRGYLIRGGRARQITRDHSWVAMQVEEGILTPEQAEHHPNRSLLMRALGRQPSVEVEISQHQLQAGDVLLLCSDGLTGVVGDAEIGEYASRYAPETAADQLVNLANQRGAPDNVTVVAAAITATGRQPRQHDRDDGGAGRRCAHPETGAAARQRHDDADATNDGRRERAPSRHADRALPRVGCAASRRSDPGTARTRSLAGRVAGGVRPRGCPGTADDARATHGRRPRANGQQASRDLARFRAGGTRRDRAATRRNGHPWPDSAGHGRRCRAATAGRASAACRDTATGARDQAGLRRGARVRQQARHDPAQSGRRGGLRHANAPARLTASPHGADRRPNGDVDSEHERRRHVPAGQRGRTVRRGHRCRRFEWRGQPARRVGWRERTAGRSRPGRRPGRRDRGRAEPRGGCPGDGRSTGRGGAVRRSA